MAGPLTRDAAIPALEDAVRLLRHAPLSTWVCHWVGSAPFALAAIWFWNDLTNPRTLDSTGAAESLVLALLLVWMNCWRSVFAGRLRRQLSGDEVSAPDTAWTARRVWRLAASQAFFGATKLVIMPLAWLTIFPLASSVAFYRNLAVLAGGEDADPLELMARARKLAGIQTSQSWALLPPLALLYPLVTVNLAIVLGLLPQLVRMLTGYESAFSRSGVYFVFNPLFFVFVIAVSWIAFDPFIQAVYCVRCFRGESLGTGEDLRAGLRRIIRAKAVALALVFVALAAQSSAAVPPGELEKSVQQVMQSHEYDWRLPPTADTPGKGSWLVRMADHMVAGMKAISNAIGDALRRFRRWLSGNRASVPLEAGRPPSAGLHWSLYALTGVVALLAIAIMWRRRKASKPATELPVSVIHLDAEDLSPDRLPEERWLELAAECLREENLRLALRALYLANLAWLGRSEFLTIDAGKTNREYESELKRRTRAFPEARGLFAGNVAVFERAWYGMHEVRSEDIDEFRSRVSQMKTILPEPQGFAA